MCGEISKKSIIAQVYLQFCQPLGNFASMKKMFSLILMLTTSWYAFSSHLILDGLYVAPVGGLYPGTQRTYQVYVPEQYTGHRPACLYVGLDGVLCHAPQVMDSLINAGLMPVTIGVFLQPGVISDADGNVLRYNRSNEFDATDSTFAHFLETELLPEVETMVTPDGRPIHLSHRGCDRMIFGLSSGGIAAFTAAWHRPDLFGRVFSGVGTFVAMRGGNDLQAIVRKSEPRPLKVFLQDGSNDAWNPLFGHWYEGNRMLATALEFAGYDCRFDWSDGGHNVKRSTEIFADVMTWMWSDWPDEIAIGSTKNDLLSHLLIPGEGWQETTVSHGDFKTDLTAISPDSTIMVSAENGSNYLWQYLINNGKPENRQRFYWLHSYDNSTLKIGPMAFDGNGDLWVTTNAGLQICDQNGRVRGIIMLPCEAAHVRAIIIDDNRVTLVSIGDKGYTRRFNLPAPVPGVKPKSQGQG